jgi:catechol 2,3-dioxygenase-like lactoylglutathione lyase family enzyme
MLDHIAIGVHDLQASRAFFVQALAPLGMRVVFEETKAVGLGRGQAPSLWLDAKLINCPPMHLAFTAASRAQVDEFYRQAIAAGAKDNGAPGVREHYHRDYYAAFVISPEGHNVEAVCRQAKP